MSQEKTYEQLQEELDNLKAENELLNEGYSKLQEENEALKAEVARLLNTPDAEEKSAGAGTVVEHQGKNYEILASAIRVPKFGKLTAAELAEKPEAVAELVKRKSSLLREVK